MTPVSLGWVEFSRGALCGVQRQIASMQRGLRDLHGAELGDVWGIHINGACGEIAAAKALGLYWPGTINADKRAPDLPPDLPPDWQVRTRARAARDLIVRDDDSDAQRFVLVTGVAPEFVVHGWLWGHEAKRPEWRDDKGGKGACYWVPQASLRRIGGNDGNAT